MLKAPRQLPPLSMMLDDLGLRHRDIARHLGVTERTLWAWRSKDQAPRPVMLALFWETRWGRSAIDADAVNEAQVHRAHARGLESRIRALEALIDEFQQFDGAGAANAPILDVTRSIANRVR